jgi:hypothetical protein
MKRTVVIVCEDDNVGICRIIDGKRYLTHKTNRENCRAVDFLSDLGWVFNGDEDIEDKADGIDFFGDWE